MQFLSSPTSFTEPAEDTGRDPCSLKIPKGHVKEARRVLSYLICAFGPLAIVDIAEIVAVVIDGETYYDIDSRL